MRGAAPIHPKPSLMKEADIQNLRELLPSLGEKEALAIHLRYWEMLTIQEIAKILGSSWDETDRIIEHSIRFLRAGFLENQDRKLVA